MNYFRPSWLHLAPTSTNWAFVWFGFRLFFFLTPLNWVSPCLYITSATCTSCTAYRIPWMVLPSFCDVIRNVISFHQCWIMLPELYLDFYEQSWKLIIANFNPQRSGFHLRDGRELFGRTCCHLQNKICQAFDTLGLDIKFRFMC